MLPLLHLAGHSILSTPADSHGRLVRVKNSVAEVVGDTRFHDRKCRCDSSRCWNHWLEHCLEIASLSLRDVEELLEERGLEADQTTVWRWVQRYGPELEQRVRPHRSRLTSRGGSMKP